MGIEPLFGEGLIKSAVTAYQQRVERAAIYAFKYLAEGLVKYAIEKRTYTDQTGNLTNSIGYVIVFDGKVEYMGGFVGNGDEGAEKGMQLADEIAKKDGKGISIIIVAGMNYAAYVEAKGYNVILPAELKAMTDFPATIERLREQVHKTFGVQ